MAPYRIKYSYYPVKILIDFSYNGYNKHVNRFGSTKEKYITERKAYNKISYEVNVYNLGKKKYLGKYATLDEAKKVRDNYLKTFGKSYIK